MSTNPTIWEKIDLDEYLATRVFSDAPTKEEEVPKVGWARLRHRIFWFGLKTSAVIFWIYVPAKLLVGDVDRWAVGAVAPQLRWILDYRFFVFIALLAVALIVFRRWSYAGAVLYVLFFPALVAFFYVPRYLKRQKSWMPVLGLLNVLWLTTRTARFSVTAVAVFAISALVVFLDRGDAIQIGAAIAVLALWALLLARSCRAAISPASFIRSQQRLISRLQESTMGQNLAIPAENLRRPEVVKLSKVEIDGLVASASGAVCLYAAGYFLADQLERYRKSGAAVVFSAIGVGALFLQAIALFTVVNVATWQVRPSEFAYESEPGLPTFVRYTLNSMFPGEINALQPVGTWATWVSIYAGVSVGIIVLTLVVSLFFSVRSAREDVAATESIEAMRKRSDAYAKRLVEQHGLPLEQLVGHLVEMGGAINLWFRYVSDRVGEVRKSTDSGSDPD